MRSLRVIGVPEHFNHPWHKAIKNNLFTSQNIEVKFTSAPGGTGAMVNAVLQNEADVAVALTEGIINAVILNQHTSTPLRYCGEYVTSPLRWMITTGANRDFQTLNTLTTITELLHTNPQKKLNVSVSRIGSGSHLMAYVLAQQEGWSFDQLNVCVHNDFRSMRRAVMEGTADLFLWEWFMTKPYVDSSELRILGYLDTPWHCFGFLAQAQWLDNPGNRRLLNETCTIVFEAAKQMLVEENSSCEELSAQFGISLEDSHSWIRMVSYAQELVIPHPMIKQVIDTLVQTRIMKPSDSKDYNPKNDETTKETGKTLNNNKNTTKIIHGYHIEDICDVRVGRYIAPMNDGDDDMDWEDSVPMVSISTLYNSYPLHPNYTSTGQRSLSPHTVTTIRNVSSLYTPVSSVDSSTASSVIGSTGTLSVKPLMDPTSIALHFDPLLTSTVSASSLPPLSSPSKDRPRRISQSSSGYLSRRASTGFVNDTVINGATSPLSHRSDLEIELRSKDIFTPVLMQIPTGIGLAHELAVTRNRSDSTSSVQSTDNNTNLSSSIRTIDALPIDNSEKQQQHYNQKTNALAAIMEHLGIYGGAPVQTRSEAHVPVIPFTSLPAAIDAIRDQHQQQEGDPRSSSSSTAVVGGEGNLNFNSNDKGNVIHSGSNSVILSNIGKLDKSNGNDPSSQRNSWHRYGVLVDLG